MQMRHLVWAWNESRSVCTKLPPSAQAYEKANKCDTKGCSSSRLRLVMVIADPDSVDARSDCVEMHLGQLCYNRMSMTGIISRDFALPSNNLQPQPLYDCKSKTTLQVSCAFHCAARLE